MTIEKITALFSEIASNHKQIKKFVVCEDYDFSIDESEFPVMLVMPNNANVPKNDGGYNTFTVDFDIKILDLKLEDGSNKLAVYSDAVEILKDIVVISATHPYFSNQGIVVEGDNGFDKLDGFSDEDLYGYGTTLNVTTPIEIGYCAMPLINNFS